MASQVSFEVPLFEDWFDKLSDHPANQLETDPEKAVKSEPFVFVFKNGEVVIAKMGADFYLIDLIKMENAVPGVFKTILLDYYSVPYHMDWKEKVYEIDKMGEQDLGDIGGEYIVSYVNYEYPDGVQIGETYAEWETGESYVVKIDDKIKKELFEVFSDPKLEAAFQTTDAV